MRAIFLAEGRVGLKQDWTCVPYAADGRYSWPRVGLD